MKKIMMLLLPLLILMAASCDKEKVSERFKLLTDHGWVSDQLIVNGADASGPGGFLEGFKGDVMFNEDGTGTFGQFSGRWQFVNDETSLIITTSDLPFSLTTTIDELTKTSLKVSLTFPSLGPEDPELDIVMTFKAK